MSREELEHSIAEIVNICACPDCSVPLMHKETLEVVERLLAEAREKVREMCVEVIKLAPIQHRESRQHLGEMVPDGEGTVQGILYLVKQLDLTKLESDLAASSREEKG